MKKPFSKNDGRVKKQENELKLFDLLFRFLNMAKVSNFYL